MMGDTDCGKTKKIEMGTADQMATTPTAPPVAPLLGSGWGGGLGFGAKSKCCGDAEATGRRQRTETARK